jgi:predicted nucleotide-binding protein
VLEDKQADHVIVSLAMDKELRRMVLPNQKRVFIVYGRNEKAYNAMRLFLQSLKLEPLTFDEVRNELGGSPFIEDIVRAGMGRAQAIIILLTPDEYACLRPSLCSENDKSEETARWQPRANVILEAGMALLIDESRTILVVLGKDVALASDLHGRHLIHLSNDVKRRARLRDALVGLGCSVDQAVTQWHDVGVSGDFDGCVSSVALPEVSPRSPFDPKSPLDVVDQDLRDLVIKYECCDWIDIDDPGVAQKIMEQRVAKRKAIFENMVSYCRTNPVNKNLLLRRGRSGFYVALAAAIIAKPAADDDELISAIDAKTLPEGFAQYVVVDAIISLDKNKKFASGRRQSLTNWMNQMPDLDATLQERIARFRSGIEF